MRVSRARRRFLAWHRYARRHDKLTGRRYTHVGYANAFADYTTANRCYPHGVRDVRLLP